MSNRHLTLNMPTTKLGIYLHNPHPTATAPVFPFSISCNSILSVSQAKTLTPHSLTTQYNPLGKKKIFNISRANHFSHSPLLSSLALAWYYHHFLTTSCVVVNMLAVYLILYPSLLYMWVDTFPSSTCSLLWPSSGQWNARGDVCHFQCRPTHHGLLPASFFHFPRARTRRKLKAMHFVNKGNGLGHRRP